MYDLNKYDQVLKFSYEILQKDPNHINALIYQADAYIILGLLEEATYHHVNRYKSINIFQN